MTDPYAPRPTIKHRWDGKVFHVRMFGSEDEARRAPDGPWHADRAMAKASFEEGRRRAAAPTPPNDRPAPAATDSAPPVAVDRKTLVAEAKALGLKFFAGIGADDLRAKIAAAREAAHG